jgi:hypothetical protein
MRLRKPLASCALILVSAIAAGCGATKSPAVPASATIQHPAGSATGVIVLTPLGAQRIGLQTARAVAVPVPKPPPPPPPPPHPTKTTTTSKSASSSSASSSTTSSSTTTAAKTTTTKPPAPAPVSHPAPGPTVIIPYSAIVYDPSGATYAFVADGGSLSYQEVPIVVDHISGNSAYLLTGPRPGAEVVSVGAEELFGVQTGVLAQT